MPSRSLWRHCNDSLYAKPAELILNNFNKKVYISIVQYLAVDTHIWNTMLVPCILSPVYCSLLDIQMSQNDSKPA